MQSACGRLVSLGTFELLEQGCSSLNARCGRCFKGEVVSNVEGLVSALDAQRAKRQRAAWSRAIYRWKKKVCELQHVHIPMFELWKDFSESTCVMQQCILKPKAVIHESMFFESLLNAAKFEWPKVVLSRGSLRVLALSAPEQFNVWVERKGDRFQTVFGMCSTLFALGFTPGFDMANVYT